VPSVDSFFFLLVTFCSLTCLITMLFAQNICLIVAHVLLFFAITTGLIHLCSEVSLHWITRAKEITRP
jgi:hypothetical protein